jgi:hypothetical protein
MKNLLLLPLLLCGKNLFAQAPQISTAGMAQANLNESIQGLTQNALLVLTGVVILAVLAALICLVKSCTDLNKKTKHTALFLWMLALGFGFLGGSCTPVQWAKTAQMREAQWVESPNCVCPGRHDNQQHAYHNRYANHGYANWYSHASCKHCGKRIYRSSF